MRALKYIYPSIYSANHGYLMDECTKVENMGFETLHVDIQDHVHASEISFGIKAVKYLREHSNMEFDMHLIICNLEQYLERLEGMTQIRAVTFHPVGERFPARVAGRILQMGYRVGLAFTLHEPVEDYECMRDMVSQVLVCTAAADGQGNRYNPYSETFIRRVRAVFPNQDILVDGDVNAGNLKRIKDAGATHFVMGREIFQSEDLREKTEELEQLLKT